MSRENTMLGTGMLASAMAALAAALIVALFYYAAPGMAAVSGSTMVVNTSEDELNTDGDCSLREAIQAANSNTAADECAAGSSTEEDAIRFSLGKKATITLGSSLPAITDGAGLTIKGGKAKITVSGNDSVGVFRVNSDAKLTLKKLKVAKGRASNGGGILNSGGTLTVTKTTFSGNSASIFGGGIYNEFGTLTVSNSTFSGNSATTGGGGIFIDLSDSPEVTNSTFSGNSASDFGGGIYIQDSDPLTVTNSTFSGNSASNFGGGIYSLDSTIDLKNTIVANSPNGGNCFTSGGTILDGGYNIEDGTSCSFSEANNSLPSTEPLLRALDKNGGPTKTHALRDRSPAINLIPSGTNGCGTEIKKDQRGVKRPQGNKCDVGSFEKEL